MKFKFIMAAVLLCLIPFLGMTKEPGTPRLQSNNDTNTIFAKGVTTDLGISCESGCFDLTTDNNNTVHIVWWDDDGFLHYGQISGTKVINEEVIPDSEDVEMSFMRPRIMARPDGASVHLTWMSPRPGTKLVHVWKDSSGWHREIVWHGSYVSVPVGVADLTGKMHVIGQQWTNNSLTHGGIFFSQIKYWYKPPGAEDGEYNAGWSLYEGPIKWRDTSMAIDKNGGIHVAYKSGRDPGKYQYCPNGGSLADAEILDIPVAKDSVCVSFGDLFVDRDLNVHHAFMSYNVGAIDYSFKAAGTKTWTDPYRLSDGPVPLCEETEYEHVWPGIAVTPEGIIYVTWVDMPCPEQEANRVHLMKKENGAWTSDIITTEAKIDFFSKPAITANDTGVYLLYRDYRELLVLYTISAQEIYISNPSSGQKVCAKNYANGVLPIEVTAVDPSVVTRVEFYADGGLLGEDTSSPYVYNWDISELNPGSHLIRASVTKTTGERIELEATIDIDCPPFIQLLSLFNGTTIAESTTITADVSDDKNNVQKVDFYLDNALKVSDTTPPYEYNLDTQNLALGLHNLAVIAMDGSGLSSNVSINFRYWPLFPPINATGSKNINRTLFLVEYYNHLTWSANPRNTNVQVTNYKVYQVIDGIKSTQALATLDANTFEYNHRNVSKDDSYEYVITAVDNLGYESTGQVIEIQ